MRRKRRFTMTLEGALFIAGSVIMIGMMAWMLYQGYMVRG